MKTPPANTSREARALREAANEFYNESSLVDPVDHEDSSCKRANAKLLRAALRYADAAKQARIGTPGNQQGTPEERAAWYVANWRPDIIAAALVSFEDAFKSRPTKHFVKQRRQGGTR